MLLKENYFISLYGCFEASITLSKGRWDISWVQEKYFLSSMYFETCLNHMHGDHMWKRDGQRSPTLSKVQTTVSQMAWLDKQVTITTLGCGVTAEELLLQELSAPVLQPPSKRQVTPLERYSTFASGWEGEFWYISGSQLVCWKVMWPCDCHPCSELQHWRKGREPCNSWGLKNSFQPQKLNWPWIICSISASAAVTLCRPWVSNLAQVSCQTECTQITETQQVSEDTLSQRKSGLLLSALCRGNYSSSSSKMAAWWGAGARDAPFQGHLSAQYNTSAALLLKAV